MEFGPGHVHDVFHFSVSDVVAAMKFGRFGREDSAMVMITTGGALTVKILKRTAQFEKLESALAPQLSKVKKVIKQGQEPLAFLAPN